MFSKWFAQQSQLGWASYTNTILFTSKGNFPSCVCLSTGIPLDCNLPRPCPNPVGCVCVYRDKWCETKQKQYYADRVLQELLRSKLCCCSVLSRSWKNVVPTNRVREQLQRRMGVGGSCDHHLHIPAQWVYYLANKYANTVSLRASSTPRRINNNIIIIIIAIIIWWYRPPPSHHRMERVNPLERWTLCTDKRGKSKGAPPYRWTIKDLIIHAVTRVLLIGGEEKRSLDWFRMEWSGRHSGSRGWCSDFPYRWICRVKRAGSKAVFTISFVRKILVCSTIDRLRIRGFFHPTLRFSTNYYAKLLLETFRFSFGLTSIYRKRLMIENFTSERKGSRKK